MTQNNYTTWRNVMLTPDAIENIANHAVPQSHKNITNHAVPQSHKKVNNQTWLLSAPSINENKIESFQASVWALSFLS